MTEIRKAGEVNALDDIDIPQGEFRKQIAAINDAVRQLGGNPEIAPNSPQPSDPLNAPFVLFVNSYTGSDTFVKGDYATADDGTFEQKMRRISNQRLECGYTEARPFKTINRAIIEAGIITSRDYLNLNPAPCGDLVSIVIASGSHTCLNAGASDAVTEWPDKAEPTQAQLESFNPADGGVILPRGCSLISLDLRKTIIRPDQVPSPDAEASDYSNRRAMFRLTGGCYVYGMTFMDKVGYEQSHHLLDVFQFTSSAQLDEFYSKIRTAFPSSSGVDPNFAVPRIGETEIVGPQPKISTSGTDTVGSASPYLYNISNRSTYGLCGLFADGAAVNGFKSCVIAQYTGVSLQKDMNSWERYSTGTWSTVPDYDTYLDTHPDNLRQKVARRSYHIRAVNKAVIQEVSVFAIGQAVHHAVASGGEITITNSNSNWGGCSALAEGYHDEANPIDTGHIIKDVIAPLDPLASATVRRIPLGQLEAGQSTDTTTLTFAANVDTTFLDAGYTLPANDLVWVTNPYGDDFYGVVVSYDFNVPSITISGELETAGGETIQEFIDNRFAGEEDDTATVDDFLAGQTVYLRRLQDNRSVTQRSVRFSVNSNSDSRRPVRDYIPVEDNGALPVNEIASVLTSGGPEDEVGVDYLIQFRYAKRTDIAHSATAWYAPGDTVVYQGKHYTAIKRTRGAFDASHWDESFVHMPETFAPEGYYKNLAPIVIIDGDTDPADDLTLGVTTLPAQSTAQIENAIDYVGAQIYLRQVGLGSISLDPTDEANRRKTVGKTTNFHRPSNIRLYSHAFEWAGFANYSKAVPKYQLDLSATNKFTYYFTNEAGGRVYCSGFNEEGQAVTNAGLQDFESGSAISFDQVGNGELSVIDIQEGDIAKATKDPDGKAGTVVIASADQIQAKLDNNTDVSDSNQVSGYRVVEVNDLDQITAWFARQQSDSGLLEDTKSILYIHQDVVRATGSRAATEVPQAVIDVFNTRPGVHGGSASSAVDTAGSTILEQVSFNNLYQASVWLDGRSPVGRDKIRIIVIGKCDGLNGVNDSDYDQRVMFTSTKTIRITGNTGQSTDVVYLGDRIETEAGTGTLQIDNVTVSVGGTIANENAPVSKNFFGVFRSDVLIYSATIRGRSDLDFIAFYMLDGDYKTTLRYQEATSTSITFDLKSTGTSFNASSGHSDIRFNKLVLENYPLSVGAVQTNQLTFKLSKAITAPTKFHRIEIYEADVRVGSNSQNRANTKLNISFDFAGSSQPGFRIDGPIRDSIYEVYGEGALTSNVVNKGSLNTAEIFTCISNERRLELKSFIDATQDTDSGASAINGNNVTFSKVLAEAFRDKGLTANDITLPLEFFSNNDPALPCNNVYNGAYYSSNCKVNTFTSGTDDIGALLLPEDDD